MLFDPPIGLRYSLICKSSIREKTAIARVLASNWNAVFFDLYLLCSTMYSGQHIKDSDQSVYPRSLIKVFDGCSMGSKNSKEN